MPVLKRQQAAPALKDAIVLDLGDVTRQAERIRQKAQEQADRIVREAEQRAQQLVEGAEDKGREQGYAAGHEQGLTEGRQQGHAEALEQARAQLEQIEAAWTQAAERWAAQRRQLESDARRDVVELALKVAEKLVHRVVEVDETVVADQLAAALSHVLRPLDVSVRIHPDDRPLLGEAMPRVASQFPHLEHIDLIDDETVGRGGCVVSFGQGQVDASLQTQLERIAHALLPEDVAPRRALADAAEAHSENESSPKAPAPPSAPSDTPADTPADTPSEGGADAGSKPPESPD